jgi:hypothetical protein
VVGLNAEIVIWLALHYQPAYMKCNSSVVGLFTFAVCRFTIADCRLDYFQGIPQWQRIEDGCQVVVTIFTLAYNMKAKIYLTIGEYDQLEGFVF